MNDSHTQNKYRPNISQVPSLERFQVNLPVPILMDRRKSLLYGHFRNRTGKFTASKLCKERQVKHKSSYTEYRYANAMEMYIISKYVFIKIYLGNIYIFKNIVMLVNYNVPISILRFFY